MKTDSLTFSKNVKMSDSFLLLKHFPWNTKSYIWCDCDVYRELRESSLKFNFDNNPENTCIYFYPFLKSYAFTTELFIVLKQGVSNSLGFAFLNGESCISRLREKLEFSAACAFIMP